MQKYNYNQPIKLSSLDSIIILEGFQCDVSTAKMEALRESDRREKVNVGPIEYIKLSPQDINQKNQAVTYSVFNEPMEIKLDRIKDQIEIIIMRGKRTIFSGTTAYISDKIKKSIIHQIVKHEGGLNGEETDTILNLGNTSYIGGKN